ncbi:hypothetical protein QP713_08985 [Neisseria mucosa]|uniref:Uncharacterized protein n=1 Tax=Neisseria mucosa TaxID=488 RepID=A0AAW6ZD50_NEIMU|nr:hypothetical protein [Neisseria mucosa]MDK6725579.1 hypothetical protein [Neisseria mucosa]MDK6871262.1 hypothetical protein [Neisseria mucosa]MDK8110914.1 hypothetical protein [Neisseria mucosa]MDK8362209.1 hypothetical protein [Neisseria mucosa]
MNGLPLFAFAIFLNKVSIGQVIGWGSDKGRLNHYQAFSDDISC